MAIVSGEYHLCDIFIDNFLVFFKKGLYSAPKNVKSSEKSCIQKKTPTFFHKFVIG